MGKLYELTATYKQFNEIVQDALDNEELTEDELQMFIDTIDSIKDSIENKVENTVKFMKNIESDIDGLKKEEKRLAARRKAIENTLERLKSYVGDELQKAGIKSLNAGHFKVKFQKSNPSVEVLSEDDVPEQYREKQPDKILKKDILDALKKGEEIAGVLLVTDKEHLRIS